MIFVKICSSKDSWGQRRGPDSYPFGSTCLFSVHTHKIVCFSFWQQPVAACTLHVMSATLCRFFFTSIVLSRAGQFKFFSAGLPGLIEVI